jgi:hypothetical protein
MLKTPEAKPIFFFDLFFIIFALLIKSSNSKFFPQQRPALLFVFLNIIL